ncbi:MAG: hypothetical protein LBT95_04405 [Treponema sp.]|jgi:hypothetical protein|nr:hypothetical protein [Treponema sp.]
MKIKPAQRMPVLVSVFALVFSLASCSDFFSTPLFPGAARDPSRLIPPVTVNNVDDLILKSENNPALALAVLQKIQAALKGLSEDEARRLQVAALKAAANAVAIGPSLFNSLGGMPTSLKQGQMRDLLADALKGIPNLPETGAALVAVIPDPEGDKGNFDAFTKSAKTDDLVFASLTLVAAEVKENGSNLKDYIASFNASDQLPPQADLAVRIAQAAAKKIQIDGEALTIPLHDILRELNLI